VRRAFARFAYVFRSAFRGLRSSPVTSAVAVATISVSLVLAGTFFLLVRNMEELLGEFGDDLHVTVYIADGVSADRQRELARIAMTVEGVDRVRVVSKEEALATFRSGVGRGAAFLAGLDENPLPASLEIVLAPESRSAAGLAVVVESIDGLSGISEVSWGRDWVEGYLRVVALIRGVGFGLGVILAAATLLIVSNTIRLAVYTRRDELDILSLVGASRTFVTTPFMLEGIAQGALGGALALGLLYALFRLALPGFEFGLELVLGGAPRFFDATEASGLVMVGAALGLLGSTVSVVGSARP
jgi:cell division transport system permease protein